MRTKRQANKFLLISILLAFFLTILGTWGIPAFSPLTKQHPDLQTACAKRAYAKTMRVNGQFCAQVLSCEPGKECQEHQHRYACATTPRQYVFRTHEKQQGCFELFAKESKQRQKGPFVRLCDLCSTQVNKAILQ